MHSRFISAHRCAAETMMPLRLWHISPNKKWENTSGGWILWPYPVKRICWGFFFFLLDNVWIFAVFLGHRNLLMWAQINAAATHPFFFFFFLPSILRWAELPEEERKKAEQLPFLSYKVVCSFFRSRCLINTFACCICIVRDKISTALSFWW